MYYAVLFLVHLTVDLLFRISTHINISHQVRLSALPTQGCQSAYQDQSWIGTLGQHCWNLDEMGANVLF